MKSYTDLEQSKKLAEILPLESADMYYHYSTSVVKNYHEDIPNVIELNNHFAFFNDDIPCWSLVALLDASPNGIVINKDAKDGKYHISSTHIGTYIKTNNLIDACYEMIIKLQEQNII